jgi:peptide/nickel transport system permease protein
MRDLTQSGTLPPGTNGSPASPPGGTPKKPDKHLERPGGAVPPIAESFIEKATPQASVASPWKLIWWKFRKHKLAMIGTVVTILIYLVALFAEFLAPYSPNTNFSQYTYTPPQVPKISMSFSDGFDIGLYVNGYKSEVDTTSFKRVFTVDEDTRVPFGFFVKGE